MVDLVAVRTQWRGQRDTTAWRFTLLLGVSVLLHAPFTPVAALLGFLALLGPPSPSVPTPDLGQIRAIPLDLVEMGPPDRPALEEPKSIPTSPRVELAPPSGPKDQVLKDAGAPHDAGAQDSGQLDGSSPEAGEPSDGSADASSGDPVALSGQAGQIADANANVRLIVYTEAIREHPLGVRVGKLLASIGQWRDFFGPGALDPVRDFDRILVAGPQLRDSSEVVAVLRYNVDTDRVRSAVDAIVRRDPAGGWVDAGVPAANARADRAQRLFVILPEASLAIVTPPSAAAHALSLAGKRVAFPAAPGAQAVRAHVATPWRIFIGLPFSIPRSIESAEFSLIPTVAGGATLEVTLEDASPQQAEEDRDLLWTAFRSNELVPLLEFAAGRLSLRLRAEGSQIRATLDLTPQQVAFAMNLVEGWILERTRARTPRASDAGEGDAQAPRPPALPAPEAGGPPLPRILLDASPVPPPIP